MKTVYPLILLSVAISACAQIALKAGMASPHAQRMLAGSPGLPGLVLAMLSPMVIVGLALYFASAAVWLLVLSRVEVSFAYPFVALGFVFTAVLGRVVFGDAMSAAKIVGTLLIMGGVVVMARG